MNREDQDFIVQKIRTQYTEKDNTGLEELKELDRKVARPANVFAYTFGSIGAIIMGSGMSLVMTDIGERLGESAMPIGVAIGVVGLIMVIINYPIYKKMLEKGKKKYAFEIVELAKEISGT